MASTAGGMGGRTVSPRVMAVLEDIRTGAPITGVAPGVGTFAGTGVGSAVVVGQEGGGSGQEDDGEDYITRGDLFLQLDRIYTHHGLEFRWSERARRAFQEGGSKNGLNGMSPEDRFKAIARVFGYDERQVVLLLAGANPTHVGPPADPPEISYRGNLPLGQFGPDWQFQPDARAEAERAAYRENGELGVLKLRADDLVHAQEREDFPGVGATCSVAALVAAKRGLRSAVGAALSCLVVQSVSAHKSSDELELEARKAITAFQFQPDRNLQEVIGDYRGPDLSGWWMQPGGIFDPSSADTQWFVKAFLETGLAGISTGNRYQAVVDRYESGRFEEAFYLSVPLTTPYPGDEDAKEFLEAWIYLLNHADMRVRLQEETEPYKIPPPQPGAELGSPPPLRVPTPETADSPPEGRPRYLAGLDEDDPYGPDGGFLHGEEGASESQESRFDYFDHKNKDGRGTFPPKKFAPKESSRGESRGPRPFSLNDPLETAGLPREQRLADLVNGNLTGIGAGIGTFAEAELLGVPQVRPRYAALLDDEDEALGAPRPFSLLDRLATRPVQPRYLGRVEDEDEFLAASRVRPRYVAGLDEDDELLAAPRVRPRYVARIEDEDEVAEDFGFADGGVGFFSRPTQVRVAERGPELMVSAPLDQETRRFFERVARRRRRG